MENIVKEENFIKNESQQVDDCLNRCKNLANIMVTMKKLAMVQDPMLKKINQQNSYSKVSTTGSKLTGVATTIQNNFQKETNDFLCLLLNKLKQN